MNTLWPYPFWIAHRGAGKLAPENTLAAFRVGAQHGYRAFECDVKLSADGVPFLLHDDTLERTTSGQGVASTQDWGTLSQLDAGSWHSRACAGEPIPTLSTIAHYCVNNDLALNIELKPSPGDEAHTGKVVAEAAAQLWANANRPPLLSSFSLAALQGAQHGAPQLPRALLLKTMTAGWLEQAQSLACVAVVTAHTLMSADLIEHLHAGGLRALAYTVNDLELAQRLIAMGADGLITDAVDRFAPGEPTAAQLR
jgi:glycerophosphoryl diester phosphodiesterase